MGRIPVRVWSKKKTFHLSHTHTHTHTHTLPLSLFLFLFINYLSHQTAVTVAVRPEDVFKDNVIHIVAARAMIRDIEDRLGTRQASDQVDAIALKYNLLSSSTSFVAVQQQAEEASWKSNRQRLDAAMAMIQSTEQIGQDVLVSCCKKRRMCLLISLCVYLFWIAWF